MKKLISKLLLFMAVLAMAFSLAACGTDSRAERERRAERQERRAEKEKKEEEKNKDDKDDEDKDDDEDEDKNKDSKDEEESGQYDSVEDYVKSDEVQDALDAIEGTLGSGMSIEITAEGNKMIYSFKYETIEKQDGMAEQLESAMKAEEATFQETADELKRVIKGGKASVVIEYIDCNGEVIYSKEYIAK